MAQKLRLKDTPFQVSYVGDFQVQEPEWFHPLSMTMLVLTGLAHALLAVEYSNSLRVKLERCVWGADLVCDSRLSLWGSSNANSAFPTSGQHCDGHSVMADERRSL